MFAVCASMLLGVGFITTVPAQALRADVGSPRTSVTILLKAPNPAGLKRLARATGLSRAQRMAALAPLLPSAATRDRVAAGLAAEGYTVTDQTAWTITAAAPVTTVSSDFGSAVASPPATGVVPHARPTISPTLPAAITDATAAALPTGGPAVFTPSNLCAGQCHNGRDFRNAYTPPRVNPSTGHDPHGVLTIATLQFAGWNESDLTTYAKRAGVADPVASGQYVQIPVGEPNNAIPAASKREFGADEEVDLDQETLLSTDPSANQRAYFAPANSIAGYASDLGQVLADVTQSAQAYQGGDPHIAALSTSWGTCESEFSQAFGGDTLPAVENMLTSLSAAGVTVFAASGDNGIYDCGDSPQSTKVAVDYPASSPAVVAVGGTRLRATGTRGPNTGANWTDTAWSCKSATTCQGVAVGDTGGSGGGESAVFAQPRYQRAALTGHNFITSTGHRGSFGAQPDRLVPDIADDGDPATGFTVVTTDPTDVPSCPKSTTPGCTPGAFAVGGTSLSSPEAAALFTNMLAAHGVTAGVGDIHAALYSAYAAHRAAFRDITSGRNGSQHDVDAHAATGSAFDLPVTAGQGYDTVTGLGAPLWLRIAPFIFAPTAPTATGTLSLTNPEAARHASDVTASWGWRQGGTAGSLGSSASVTIRRLGTTSPIFRHPATDATGRWTFSAVPGSTYVMSVSDRDLARQRSATVTTTVVVPLDDRSFTFHGTWTRTNHPGDIAGSDTRAAVGATATVTSRGRAYALRVRTGPDEGVLAISRGGRVIGRYDLYSPTRTHRRIAFFGSPSSSLTTRTFRFSPTGQKDARSKSAAVDLDALYVSR
jgi:hypothetical protein